MCRFAIARVAGDLAVFVGPMNIAVAHEQIAVSTGTLDDDNTIQSPNGLFPLAWRNTRHLRRAPAGSAVGQDCV